MPSHRFDAQWVESMPEAGRAWFQHVVKGLVLMHQNQYNYWIEVYIALAAERSGAGPFEYLKAPAPEPTAPVQKAESKPAASKVARRTADVMTAAEHLDETPIKKKGNGLFGKLFNRREKESDEIATQQAVAVVLDHQLHELTPDDHQIHNATLGRPGFSRKKVHRPRKSETSPTLTTPSSLDQQHQPASPRKGKHEMDDLSIDDLDDEFEQFEIPTDHKLTLKPELDIVALMPKPAPIQDEAVPKRTGPRLPSGPSPLDRLAEPRIEPSISTNVPKEKEKRPEAQPATKQRAGKNSHGPVPPPGPPPSGPVPPPGLPPEKPAPVIGSPGHQGKKSIARKPHPPPGPPPAQIDNGAVASKLTSPVPSESAGKRPITAHETDRDKQRATIRPSMSVITPKPSTRNRPKAAEVSDSSALTSMSPSSKPPLAGMVLPPYTDHLPKSTVSAACDECACKDFAQNPFKPGFCNNCFHKH